MLQRNSIIKLKIYDYDKGKDNDLMGITAIDLKDIPLDEIHTSKHFISGVGSYNCKNSKIEISLQIISNDSIIKIVPDDDDDDNKITQFNSDAIELVEKAVDALDLSLNLDNDNIKNTLLKFITEDKIDYFPEEQIFDLLLDASSLTDVNHDITPSSSLSYNAMFNRTDLRIMDSSKIILKTNNNNNNVINDCYRHPPIGKNMLKLNLEENDNKYILIKFNNRFLSWLCCRWILLLYKVWNHQSAEIPHWANLSSYTFIATMITISADNNNNNNKIYNNISCTISFDHLFEIRTSTNEIIKLTGLSSLVISSDSQLPKSYIMNIEIISYSMTGRYDVYQCINIILSMFIFYIYIYISIYNIYSFYILTYIYIHIIFY